MDEHVDLGASLDSYVDRLVQEGAYASREEVIRDGVRRMQEAERALWLAEFDASIREAIADSQAGRVRDATEVFDELEARYAAMAEARDKQ